MRTRYDEDQQAIAEAFAALFERESPVEVVRTAEAGCGFDQSLWDTLAAAGAPGMAVPAELGGGGSSLVNLAVVAYEWGRSIAPVPLVEHAVACRLLACAAREEPAGLVEELAAGELVGTIALRAADRSGVSRLVPAGAVADVVVAMRANAIVVAHGSPPGVARPNTAGLPLADRDVSTALVVASGTSARRAWDQALAEWQALTAVAYAGLGRQALDMGVDYVKQRHQFGVPVGSFQAVQHGLADAATRLEGARLLAFRSACALDAGADNAKRLASMALLFAADAARFVTDRALHYHGGYGYSAEYDIQLYYRRAAAWLLQLAERAVQTSRLAHAELGPKTTAASTAP